MRCSLVLLTAVLVAGCDSGTRKAATKGEPVSVTAERAATENSAAPGLAAAPATTVERAAPLAMSKDEIADLVKSLVAEELAKREQTTGQSATAAAERRAQEERSAMEAAEREAQAAAKKEAAVAAATERKEDEAVARFLLLPEELDRVDRLKQKLETESIWGLTSQDLDFAAQGLAAPLLRDSLYAAAERYDPNIELDALARKANLTPDEKVEMATMMPIERQQLLMFAAQLDKGEKTVSADRYMREYVVRYPFVRKLLLEYVRNDRPPQ